MQTSLKKIQYNTRLTKDEETFKKILENENEAIAVEARQESEASIMYAEQKEEEVKILGHSVEELECTINVLEKKVNEMDEEVERHRIMRDSLELETQALRERLLTVENYVEIMESEHSTGRPAEDQLIRSVELHDAHKRIIALEKELAEQTKAVNLVFEYILALQIRQSKEYISELLLHAEAQASQYQQKYKTLEAMVQEIKIDSSNIIFASSMLDKTEKRLSKPRGSSSPFRYIGGLVQQMNVEKEKELSAAKIRIEELTVLNASQQQEVCMLNTRLAAAESMTHDVIQDLLGVKLDMLHVWS